MTSLESFAPVEPFRLLYAAHHVFEDQPSAPERSGQYPRYHQEILQLLESFDIEAEATDTVDGISEKIACADYIFSLMNRVNMTNGEVYISALCEYHRKPYLGARPSVRALAEDKSTAKHLATSLGITTPHWVVVAEQLPAPNDPVFSGPYFVKPRFGAGSEYITLASYRENWKEAVDQAELLVNAGQEAMIEKFHPGVNITIPILGGRDPTILPAVVLEAKNDLGILTHEDKLQLSGEMPFSVLRLGTLVEDLSKAASALFDEIRPVDYARFDFRLEPSSGMLAFLEMNICCDISSFGSFMFAAKSS